MERTFVMVKPDGVQRALIGRVICAIEDKGLKIVALKMMSIHRDLAEEHYVEHKGKPFFNALVGFITSGPVVAMVVEGKDAVNTIRKMMGATNPLEAQPGTIRFLYGMDLGRNVIHGSDSLKSAEREISLFFSSRELLAYKKEVDKWIYE